VAGAADVADGVKVGSATFF